MPPRLISQLPLPTLPIARWHEAMLWVAASIAIYALACITARLVERRGGHPVLRQPWMAPWSGLARWLARILWLIIPGYLALLRGALSPRLMGLTQIDLGPELGYGALFTAAAIGLLLSAGLTYRRQRLLASPYPSHAMAISTTIQLILEAGALQWHWAFYRSAVSAALISVDMAQPVYWGTWLGVGLLCAEGALNPYLWRDLRTPGLAEARVLRAVLLLVTSVLYLISRNFWWMWLLHALAISVLEPRLTTSEAQPPGNPDNKEGSRQQDRRQQP